MGFKRGRGRGSERDGGRERRRERWKERAFTFLPYCKVLVFIGSVEDDDNDPLRSNNSNDDPRLDSICMGWLSLLLDISKKNRRIS